MEFLKIEDIKKITNDTRNGERMKEVINDTIKEINNFIKVFAKEGESFAGIPIVEIVALNNDYIRSHICSLLTDAGYGVFSDEDEITISW